MDQSQEFVLSILAAVGVSGATAGVLIWLTKSWISERLKSSIRHEYSEKLETMKATLQAENNKEVEKLKAELRVVSTERQIQFAELHKKRAEAIEDVYVHLQDLTIAYRKYLDARISVENIGGKSDNATTKRRKFNNIFRSKRIYLPKDIEEQVLELRTMLDDSAEEIQCLDKDGAPNRYLEGVREKFDANIRKIFPALKKEFRMLLGDEGEAT